jgi:transposase-like protein
LLYQKKSRFHLGLDPKVQAWEIIINKKKNVSEYVIDKTAVIKVGPEYVWIWVAIIEPKNKEIRGMSISKEQNMFVDIERFISDVVEEHGEHPVFR